MATKPTMSLGLRFRRHVAGWVMDNVPTPPPGELEALEALADAAERLAVAVDVLDRDDWREVDADGVPLVANEHDNALAAWRALGEVQP